MTGTLSRIRLNARRAARAAAFTVAGVVFGLVGLGFLTVALWLLVAAHEGRLVAFAVIGGLYLVLGFCFLVLGGQRGAEPGAESEPPPPTGGEPFMQMAEGFARGMRAGQAARERH